MTETSFIFKTPLFRDISESETINLLKCLGSRTVLFQKGDCIHHAEDIITTIDIVIRGSVNIEKTDIWGNVTIVENIGEGQIFAAAYAFAKEASLVDMVAAAETEVLCLETHKIMSPCSLCCPFHHRLLRNTLQLIAKKNLALTRKIEHTSSKSIRGRVLSYLSFQAEKNKQTSFEIPFNRQQLADYLSVERSALSNELSKMRREGLIEYHKNKFVLKTHTK